MSFTRNCVKKGSSTNHGIPASCAGCNWWRTCYPEIVWWAEATAELIRGLEKVSEKKVVVKIVNSVTNKGVDFVA